MCGCVSNYRPFELTGKLVQWGTQNSRPQTYLHLAKIVAKVALTILALLPALFADLLLTLASKVASVYWPSSIPVEVRKIFILPHTHPLTVNNDAANLKTAIEIGLSFNRGILYEKEPIEPLYRQAIKTHGYLEDGSKSFPIQIHHWAAQCFIVFDQLHRLSAKRRLTEKVNFLNTLAGYGHLTDKIRSLPSDLERSALFMQVLIPTEKRSLQPASIDALREIQSLSLALTQNASYNRTICGPAFQKFT